MKTSLTIKSFFMLIAVSYQLSGGELVRTDKNKLFRDEVVSPTSDEQVEFMPGIYDVGRTDKKKSSHLLIMDCYINSKEGLSPEMKIFGEEGADAPRPKEVCRGKLLAILVPKNLERKGEGLARIFQVRPSNDGSRALLAPIVIDENGLPLVSSQAYMPEAEAKLLEVTKRFGDQKYPFDLTTINDDTFRGYWGIRGSRSKRPSLNAYPSGGAFVASRGKRNRPTAKVHGEMLTTYDSQGSTQQYFVKSINGNSNKFNGIYDGEFDPVLNEYLPKSMLHGFVVFVHGVWERESMILFEKRPLENHVYKASFHKIVKAGLWHRFFPGREYPKHKSE